jgi:hypothetical protein
MEIGLIGLIEEKKSGLAKLLPKLAPFLFVHGF